MKIKISNLVYLMLYFMVVFTANIIMMSVKTDVMSGLKGMGYFVLGELLLFLFLNTKINGRFLNFASVFIVTLFIFNFGQLMLLAFFKDIYPHIRFLLILSSDSALYGFKIISIAFAAMNFGILVSCARTDKKAIIEKELDINSKYNWEEIAKVIVILTFPVKIALDLYTLFVSVTEGGEAARLWVNSFPNVFLYYGKISLVGIALLIIIYKSKPQKQTNLFLFIEIYILIMMISGIRSENVGYLLIIMFIYFASKKEKIHIRTVLIYGFLGYLMLTFVVATADFRFTETKNLTTLMESFSKAFTEKNVILFLLDQLGDTGYTAQCVISKWLPYYPAFNGVSYIWGWLAVVPNVPGITNIPGELTARSSFPLYMQRYGTLNGNYLNIGGSLIGELFFNFNIWGGVIGAFFIGLLIGKITRKSKMYFEMQNYYGLAKYIPIMYACIYWIRDYFGGSIREAVWGPVFCILVMNMYTRKKDRKSRSLL